MPAHVPIDSDLPAIEPGIVELEVHHFSSLLAQIEVASCSRAQPELLFRDLSPLIYTLQNL